MDLIEKMIDATEQAIVAQTGFKKLDFSFMEADNIRLDFKDGFAVKPTTLEQAEGGVGFLFFRQSFRLSIFKKIYKHDARRKLFELTSELAKIFQKLYTIRVTGDDYQVVNIDNVSATEPEFDDTFVKVDVDFGALYRMTNVF